MTSTSEASSLEISALIGWAEKLTGPDRAFDAAMWCCTELSALGRPPKGFDLAVADGWHFECEPNDDGSVTQWVTNGLDAQKRARRLSPHFSGSLDAIVALVEKTLPGWLIQQYDAGVYGADRPTAHLFEPDFAEKSRTEKPYLRADGSGNSRPLAVCSALLRALQSKGEGNG